MHAARKRHTGSTNEVSITPCTPAGKKHKADCHSPHEDQHISIITYCLWLGRKYGARLARHGTHDTPLHRTDTCKNLQPGRRLRSPSTTLSKCRATISHKQVSARKITVHFVLLPGRLIALAGAPATARALQFAGFPFISTTPSHASPNQPSQCQSKRITPCTFPSLYVDMHATLWRDVTNVSLAAALAAAPAAAATATPPTSAPTTASTRAWHCLQHNWQWLSLLQRSQPAVLLPQQRYCCCYSPCCNQSPSCRSATGHSPPHAIDHRGGRGRAAVALLPGGKSQGICKGKGFAET